MSNKPLGLSRTMRSQLQKTFTMLGIAKAEQERLFADWAEIANGPQMIVDDDGRIIGPVGGAKPILPELPELLSYGSFPSNVRADSPEQWQWIMALFEPGFETKGAEDILWPESFGSVGGNGSYAYIRLYGRPIVVTRLICALARGYPPEVKPEAGHICRDFGLLADYTLCCNPLHIKWQSHEENAARRRSGKQRIISAEEWDEIFATGKPTQEARRRGISADAVTREKIRRGMAVRPHKPRSSLS
jgi:hypothetical protein